jgi:hypothetical protein
MTLRIRAKAKAHQKPSTENPGVNSAASKTTTALITNKNSPKVIKLIGSVNRTSKGLIVKLIKMMTTTRIIPESRLLIRTPLSRKSAKNTEIPPTRTLERKDVVNDEFFIGRRFRMEDEKKNN